MKLRFILLAILFMSTIIIGVSFGLASRNEDRIAMVTNGVGANLRQEPNLNGTILLIVGRNEILEIVENTGQWLLVETFDGIRGYVQTALVTTMPRPISLRLQKATELLQFAEFYLGTPYVWGGNCLVRGVDCSGFTQQVFRQFGIHLNRTSATQALAGELISRDELEPGDLLFFGTGGVVKHVAIYWGDGRLIHSGSADGGISFNQLDRGYYRTNYMHARRVL
jgi:hypothetical protein